MQKWTDNNKCYDLVLPHSPSDTVLSDELVLLRTTLMVITFLMYPKCTQINYVLCTSFTTTVNLGAREHFLKSICPHSGIMVKIHKLLQWNFSNFKKSMGIIHDEEFQVSIIHSLRVQLLQKYIPSHFRAFILTVT